MIVRSDEVQVVDGVFEGNFNSPEFDSLLDEEWIDNEELSGF